MNAVVYVVASLYYSYLNSILSDYRVYIVKPKERILGTQKSSKEENCRYYKS